MDIEDQKKFFRFLKENRAYSEFINNFKELRVKNPEGEPGVKMLLRFLDRNPFNSMLISSAFAWSDTPQKDEYWYNLFSRFREQFSYLI